jgi:hypothetical protein
MNMSLALTKNGGHRQVVCKNEKVKNQQHHKVNIMVKSDLFCCVQNAGNAGNG